jgi:2-keto-myo-inositol isomerase
MFPFCLNTSTIMPRSLPEKIEAAARAGYDLVELWSGDVEAHLRDGGTLSGIRARLTHAGLGVPSMIALTEWADIEPAAFERYLATTARERLETAAALGAPRIVASPPFRTRIDLAVAGERYAALLALGRRIGVLPSMEFLGFVPQICDVRTCLEVVARANDPDATIVLDPFHLFRGGGSFDDVRLVPGHRIGICHFNDAPGDKPREEQGDADRVLPGLGALPLADLIASLRAVGYHGPLSLELFSRALWERDATEVAAEGLRRMREVVSGAV